MKNRTTSLRKIAALMHSKALKEGSASWVLSGGLRLKLIYRVRDIVLQLWRNDVQPSSTEIEVCAQNFFLGTHLENLERRGHYVWLGVNKLSFFGVSFDE